MRELPKSAEGYLAAALFKKAQEEGCKRAINWQDQDSSSEKPFHEILGETSARVIKCGGHVGRAHGHALKDLKTKKRILIRQQNEISLDNKISFKR